ncbi:hypothetical protein BJ170DRAFT_373681 [Xylariales sp. AK1849]|nr:hypothetical protein BJ170DRAFT_373681 [Xylariales sp. AK1849]
MSRHAGPRRHSRERENVRASDQTIIIDRRPPSPPNRWRQQNHRVRTFSPEHGISRVFTEQDRLPFDIDNVNLERDRSRTRRWELTLKEKRGREYDNSVVAPLPLVKASRRPNREVDDEFIGNRHHHGPLQEDPPTQDLGNPRELLAKRKVDGIWNPSRTTDLTVHLEFGIQDDLEDDMEEFSRLYRLGNFTAARRFFADNLETHLEKPYVLVQYCEMLLQQGDYRAMIELDDEPIFNAEGNMPDSEQGRLLSMYWECMLLFAKSHKPGAASGREFGVLPAALGTLRDMITPEDRVVGSTEIKTLALIIRLSRRPHIHLNRVELHRDIDQFFPPSFYKRLYADLLRQGRVWDLHDIMLSMVYVASINDILENLFDGVDVRRGLRALIADWQGPIHEHDASTNIALLGILTSLVLEYLFSFKGHDEMIEGFLNQSMPLAMWIMENDPSSMKSRPYLRWLLAKAQYTNENGPNEVDAFLKGLSESEPGVVYHNNRRALPQYVPVKAENPGWKLKDAAVEFVNPVSLAVKISRDLGDFQTEALALQELIRLSANPQHVFDELCSLQKTVWDNDSYVDTLVSTYLLADTEDARKRLRDEMSEQTSSDGYTDYLNTDLIWMVNKLLYTLADEGPEREKAMGTIDEYYEYIYARLRGEIDKKMPELKTRAERRNINFPSGLGGGAWHMDPDQVQLDGDQDRLDAEQKILDARQKQLDSRGPRRRYDSDSDLTNLSLDEFELDLKPELLDGKKVTVSFEDLDDPTDKREMSFQHEKFTKDSKQGHATISGEDDLFGNRIKLRPNRDGTGMREERMTVIKKVSRRIVSRDASPEYSSYHSDSDGPGTRLTRRGISRDGSHRSRSRSRSRSQEGKPRGLVTHGWNGDSDIYFKSGSRNKQNRDLALYHSRSIEIFGEPRRSRSRSPPSPPPLPPPLEQSGRIVEVDSEDIIRDDLGPPPERIETSHIPRLTHIGRRDRSFSLRVFGYRLQKAKRILTILEDKLANARQTEDDLGIAVIQDVVDKQTKEIEEMKKQYDEDSKRIKTDASDSDGGERGVRRITVRSRSFSRGRNIHGRRRRTRGDDERRTRGYDESRSQSSRSREGIKIVQIVRKNNRRDDSRSISPARVQERERGPANNAKVDDKSGEAKERGQKKDDPASTKVEAAVEGKEKGVEEKASKADLETDEARKSAEVAKTGVGSKLDDDDWDGWGSWGTTGKKKDKKKKRKESSQSGGRNDSSVPQDWFQLHPSASKDKKKGNKAADAGPSLSPVPEEKPTDAVKETTRYISKDIARDESIEPVSRKPTLPTVESVEDLGEKKQRDQGEPTIEEID